MSFNPDLPVFIGFAGPAGAGKTLTAKRIVPRSMTGAYGDINNTPKEILENINADGFPEIHWDHLWFSLPLYNMFEIRTQTTGEDAESRILYQLSDIVNEIACKKISFEDMIELVYDIYSFPLNSNEEKPRSFLQGVGDLCRQKIGNDCFANYMRNKVLANHRQLIEEYAREDVDPPLYIVLLSDVRMPWEADMILNQVNHMLFRFDASTDTLSGRLLDRDGQLMTAAQSTHDTEKSIQRIHPENFNKIIQTDDLSLEEQARSVYNEIAISVMDMENIK